MTKLLLVSGVNGQVELFVKKIVIKRDGLIAKLNHGFKGDKTIPLRNITAVQFKPAGAFTNGYIQFSLLGSSENKGGMIAAFRDENTINFSQLQQPDFERLKNLVEEFIFDGEISISDVICPVCHEEIELSEDEIVSRHYTCPQCNSEIALEN